MVAPDAESGLGNDQWAALGDSEAGDTEPMEQAKRAEISSELFGVLARIVHRTAQDAATIRRRDGLELERLCHLATQALDQLPDEN